MYELSLEDLSESQVVLTREMKLILLWDEFVFHQLYWQKITSKDGTFAKEIKEGPLFNN